MSKHFLVKPSYLIYLFGNDELITSIESSLKEPKRPLYIGQSDDLVDVHDAKVFDSKQTYSDSIDSIVEGVHPSCLVESMPYRYDTVGRKISIKLKTVSIPKQFPIKLQQRIQCYYALENHVAAF